MAWTLVTGGAKRLGAEICTVLAEEKHNILVHYLSSAHEAKEVVKACREMGVEAELIKGDFSTKEKTEAFIKEVLTHHPDIENLINNVGNFVVGSALKITPKVWYDLFQTNFHTPIALIQGLMPSIRKCHGSVINIGTAGMGSMRADIKYAPYTSTKAALLWLTKSLARELAPDGVRVNMVSPGQLDISVELSIDVSSIPMRRAGTCKEAAQIVAFLLRRENNYITGQNIEVAGGLSL